MDDIDRANDLAQAHLDAAIAAARGVPSEGKQPVTHCIDCGVGLPELRIAFGAQRCVECQTEAEVRAARRY